MKTVLFIFLATLSITTQAQHNHGGHNSTSQVGEIKSAGFGFYIQASYTDGLLHVGLLDEQKNLLSSPDKKAKALVKLMGDSSHFAITMMPAPDGSFEYVLNKAGKYESVAITIVEKERTFAASFDLMNMNKIKSESNVNQNTGGHHH